MTFAELRTLTKTGLSGWLGLPASSSRSLGFCHPDRGYNIVDDAWTQMLHMALVERLQSGRDIVFTFRAPTA